MDAVAAAPFPEPFVAAAAVVAAVPAAVVAAVPAAAVVAAVAAAEPEPAAAAEAPVRVASWIWLLSVSNEAYTFLRKTSPTYEPQGQ